MSLKTKIKYILDILLRVPPLFVMDLLLRSSLGFSKLNWAESQSIINTNTIKLNLNYMAPNNSFVGDNVSHSSEDYSLDVDGTAFALICLYLFVFLCSLVMFVLSLQQLLMVYLWLSSLGVVMWSYIWNEEYIRWLAELEAQNNTSVAFALLYFDRVALLKFGTNYLLQTFLAIIFRFSNLDSTGFSWVVEVSFVMPAFLSILPLSLKTHSHLTMFWAALTLFYIIGNVLINLPSLYTTGYNCVHWTRSYVHLYGFYAFLENIWFRIHIPQVLRAFWILRLLEQTLFLLAEISNEHHSLLGTVLENYYAYGCHLLIQSCETFVAVLGMTSIISAASHYLGCLVQSFLQIEDLEDRSLGTVSAILFLVLALQTGLTSMEPDKRLLRLYRNFCLLSTALLHFIHTMVNPLLLSLGASRNTSVNKHGRALLVCTLLIAFSYWFLRYLWSIHTVSTWLLAVSAFSIEIIIKAIISLLVYLLFMIDAYRNTFWEKLDDYVYYIKATGNTVEFLFGIFLFFNGAWILLFESGGTIRACMICIHAYFNIWLQAKAGWKVFIKRRSAVNKINSLPEASQEQLRNFDDVCAICYQELNNARITRCNHFFHGVCLRKWLYVQDICPLCHNMLYNPDDSHLSGYQRHEHLE